VCFEGNRGNLQAQLGWVPFYLKYAKLPSFYLPVETDHLKMARGHSASFFSVDENC
jgi:hypothetical protein